MGRAWIHALPRMLVNTNGVLTVCAAEVEQKSVQQEGGETKVEDSETTNPGNEEVKESKDDKVTAKDSQEQQEEGKSEQKESEVKDGQQLQTLSNSTVSGNTVDTGDTGKEEQEGIQAASDLSWDSSRPGWAKRLYKMDKAVTITLSIPRELQAAGREFEMICVTEKGVPVILKDQDKDSATITITTDKFYAFALAYKDAKAKTK